MGFRSIERIVHILDTNRFASLNRSLIFIRLGFGMNIRVSPFDRTDISSFEITAVNTQSVIHVQ